MDLHDLLNPGGPVTWRQEPEMVQPEPDAEYMDQLRKFLCWAYEVPESLISDLSA